MRIDRVNHELQKLISVAINNELNDPRINGLISVIRVETSDDLGVAKVFVSIMDTKERIAQCFTAIEQASGYIRKLIKPKLKIRNVPTLVFKLDDTLEYSMHINKVIKDLNIPKEEKESE